MSLWCCESVRALGMRWKPFLPLSVAFEFALCSCEKWCILSRCLFDIHCTCTIYACDYVRTCICICYTCCVCSLYRVVCVCVCGSWTALFGGKVHSSITMLLLCPSLCLLCVFLVSYKGLLLHSTGQLLWGTRVQLVYIVEDKASSLCRVMSDTFVERWVAVEGICVYASTST